MLIESLKTKKPAINLAIRNDGVWLINAKVTQKNAAKSGSGQNRLRANVMNYF